MNTKSNIEVVSLLVSELGPFDSVERAKIVRAAFALLGDTPVNIDGSGSADALPSSEGGNLPTKAQIWMKQNGLSMEQVDQVFHIDGETVSVIAAEIPGKFNRDKVRNAYILCGIARLLSAGEPKFDDKMARKLCETSGFYDHTNHSKYLKGGNEFTGSTGAGWTLTAPGLKRGATVVDEISKAS